MDLTGIILSSIMANLVFAVMVVILFILDKDGILNSIKLKFLKGHGTALVLGKDRRIYLEVVKISGKKQGTNTVQINGLDYSVEPRKIRIFKDRPAYMYYEGVTEPLDIDSNESLGYGKLTPELLSNMLVVARQSGMLPTEDKDNMDMLKTLAIFGACGCSAIALVMIFSMQQNVTTIMQTLSDVATGLVNLMVK